MSKWQLEAANMTALYQQHDSIVKGKVNVYCQLQLKVHVSQQRLKRRTKPREGKRTEKEQK